MPTNQVTTQLKIVESGSDVQCAWAVLKICGAQSTVSSVLAEELLKEYPSLAHHACKSSENAAGTFGEGLRGAMLPHAAEHLAIELLVQTCPGETFAGNTRWESREQHTMRVRISLPKNEPADRSEMALSKAVALLNGMLALC